MLFRIEVCSFALRDHCYSVYENGRSMFLDRALSMHACEELRIGQCLPIVASGVPLANGPDEEENNDVHRALI